MLISEYGGLSIDIITGIEHPPSGITMELGMLIEI
jgi:hypothetical protein